MRESRFFQNYGTFNTNQKKKVPQFWKNRHLHNCVLKINGLYQVMSNRIGDENFVCHIYGLYQLILVPSKVLMYNVHTTTIVLFHDIIYSFCIPMMSLMQAYHMLQWRQLSTIYHTT